MKWLGTTDVQNTFTAALASGSYVDNDDAKDDLAEWVDDIYATIIAALPTSLTFEDLDFYNLTQDSPMGTLAWPTMTAGGASTDEIAATGVAYVITAFTSIVRVHGRKYFGPIVEPALDVGVINPASMAYLASCITTWITPFVGGTSGETWAPGVWRRLTSGFAVFRDAVVRNIPGYQRRRKQNVGS
jgi:hypothetical protein